MRSIFLLLFFLPFTLKADLGAKLLFKAKYVLKDGKTVTGFIEANSDAINYYPSQNVKFTDKDFHKLLIDYSHSYRFSKIQVIKHFMIEERGSLGIVNEENIVEININDIKYTVFIEISFPQYHFGALNFVEKQDYTVISSSKSSYYVNYMYDMSEIHVLSYNTELTKKEVNKLVSPLAEYLSSSYLDSDKYSKKTHAQMKSLVNELKRKKIYIFTFNYAC